MKLILLGYMGSGKSIVGSQLANTLSYSFQDLDKIIEEKELCSISQLFKDKGEIYFRNKETKLLLDLLQSKTSLVLSTGGGTPCYGSNMDKLLEHEEVITIYLKASILTLTDRLFKEKKKRPIIDHLKTKNELKEFIGKHLFERAQVYERSQITIYTEDLSVSEISAKIIAKLF
jgi:shikimate kinase